MNFYDYYQPGEDIEGGAVYAAALQLIASGHQVIPLVKGDKIPANIKSVYSLLASPIHSHNIDFYFKDRNVDIGIILQEGMEVLDIDAKQKKGLTQSVLHAVESGWPELYERLPVAMTPTGGAHLPYRAEIVGGDVALAKKYAKPQPVALIERLSRSNGKNYLKIAPSDGYHFVQGDPLNLPMLTAEERNWLGAVCASFNEVVIPEVKKREAERKDSPWNVFNSSHGWQWIQQQLLDRGWQAVMETDEKLTVKRPGATSRHSGYIFKDNSTLYLFSSSTEFEDGKAYSPFGVYALLQHDGNIGAASRQLASEGIGISNTEEGTFWRKKGRNKIEIKYQELINWLHAIGYRKFAGSLVQVVNNVVTIVEVDGLKRAFLSEVEPEVFDHMCEKVGTIFSDAGGLMALLDELPDKFIRDSRADIWLFFKNTAIRINGGVTTYEYSKLDGYIWGSEIIDRDYYECPFQTCDAYRFVEILGGTNAGNLCKIIGYNISRYKDPLNPRATVIMEDIEAEEEGESQGGSGKGLLFQFIKQFRKAAEFNGKTFNPMDPFVWQNVEPDTSIILIDDVDKKFKFSSLFSVLTGSMQVNKKNRPQVVIPFERSSKIFITSNFSVGEMDISTMRRKYEFAVNKYFGIDLEPIDEFGREFFTGWDREEWARFDNFIIDCCKLYLAEPIKKNIGIETENTRERSLIHNTNAEFVEYMDSQLERNFFDFAPDLVKNGRVINRDGSLVTNAVNMELVEKHLDNPDYYFTMSKEDFAAKIRAKVNYKGLSMTKITRWLHIWGEARGVEIDSRFKKTTLSDKVYRVVKWPEVIPTLEKSKSGHAQQYPLQSGYDVDEEPPF